MNHRTGTSELRIHPADVSRQRVRVGRRFAFRASSPAVGRAATRGDAGSALSMPQRYASPHNTWRKSYCVWKGSRR